MKSITTAEAAAIIGASPEFVRSAMKQGAINIGSCVKTKESNRHWAYNISMPLLAEYSGKDVAKELARLRNGTGYITKDDIINRLNAVNDGVKAGKAQEIILELIKELEAKEVIE